ncbi:hypothetical protein [Nostoc sp.]
MIDSSGVIVPCLIKKLVQLCVIFIPQSFIDLKWMLYLHPAVLQTAIAP